MGKMGMRKIRKQKQDESHEKGKGKKEGGEWEKNQVISLFFFPFTQWALMNTGTVCCHNSISILNLTIFHNRNVIQNGPTKECFVFSGYHSSSLRQFLLIFLVQFPRLLRK